MNLFSVPTASVPFHGLLQLVEIEMKRRFVLSPASLAFRAFLLVPVVLIILSVPSPANAQQARPSFESSGSDLNDQLNRVMILRLMKRVGELEARIKELESNQKSDSVPQPARLSQPADKPVATNQ